MIEICIKLSHNRLYFVRLYLLTNQKLALNLSNMLVYYNKGFLKFIRAKKSYEFNSVVKIGFNIYGL